jgi:2,3-bisphosphoglycerate-independent phosphoglycerate mutase
MKYIIFLIDGLADEPQPSLEGHTPLEMAVTPCLDDLALDGRIGRIERASSRPLNPLAGLIGLLGAQASPADDAAGWLFARGDGVVVRPGEVAFRMAFTCEADGQIHDPFLSDLTEPEEKALLDLLGNSADFKGWRFQTGVSGSLYALAPAGTKVGRSPLPWLRETRGHSVDSLLSGNPTAAQAVRVGRKLLAEQHLNLIRVDLGMNPANGIWLWGASSEAKLTPLADRLPLRTGCVAPSPMGRGVALSLGVACDELRYVKIPAITEGGDHRVSRAAERALRDSFGEMKSEVRGVLDLCAVAIVHIHAADAASCRARPEAKRRAVELMDEVLLGPVVAEYSKRDVRIAVAATSANNSGTGRDAGGPLPFVMWGTDLESSRGERMLTLTERNTMKSEFVVRSPEGFIGAVLNAK